MAIRFKLREDGRPDTIEADSMEEATKVYRQFFLKSRTNGAGKARLLQGAKAHEIRIDDKEMPETAKRLARILVSAPDGILSPSIADALKVDPKGLGGFVVALTRWAKRVHGLARNDVVSKTRYREGEQFVRKMKPGEGLMRLVNEHKISL